MTAQTYAQPLRIFIGYDHRQAISYNVLQFSIFRRCSKPVAITPLFLPSLPLTRTGLTPFTYSRFLTPWLAACDGWSVLGVRAGCAALPRGTGGIRAATALRLRRAHRGRGTRVQPGRAPARRPHRHAVSQRRARVRDCRACSVIGVAMQTASMPSSVSSSS